MTTDFLTLKRPAGGGKLMVINPLFREAEKHESFPVKQSYTAWRNKRVLREKS